MEQLSVKPSDSVEYIKKLIGEKLGVPKDKLHLTFGRMKVSFLLKF
jgi:hypothetical protein